MGNTSDSLKRNCDSIISLLETLSIKEDMTHFVYLFLFYYYAQTHFSSSVVKTRERYLWFKLTNTNCRQSLLFKLDLHHIAVHSPASTNVSMLQLQKFILIFLPLFRFSFSLFVKGKMDLVHLGVFLKFQILSNSKSFQRGDVRKQSGASIPDAAVED